MEDHETQPTQPMSAQSSPARDDDVASTKEEIIASLAYFSGRDGTLSDEDKTALFESMFADPSAIAAIKAGDWCECYDDTGVDDPAFSYSYHMCDPTLHDVIEKIKTSDDLANLPAKQFCCNSSTTLYDMLGRYLTVVALNAPRLTIPRYADIGEVTDPDRIRELVGCFMNELACELCWKPFACKDGAVRLAAWGKYHGSFPYMRLVEPTIDSVLGVDTATRATNIAVSDWCADDTPIKDMLIERLSTLRSCAGLLALCREHGGISQSGHPTLIGLDHSIVKAICAYLTICTSLCTHIAVPAGNTDYKRVSHHFVRDINDLFDRAIIDDTRKFCSTPTVKRQLKRARQATDDTGASSAKRQRLDGPAAHHTA